MTNDQWVVLRQVIVATEDEQEAAAEWQAAYGLGEGFHDPELEGISMRDVTLRVGPEAYLQTIAAAAEGTPLERWLGRNGGPGGYLLSIQVPDADVRVAAAEAQGVAVVLDTTAFDRRVVHLHPKVLGLLIELDEIPERDQWFWADIEPELAPDPQVDDVLGIEMGTPNPAALAAAWAGVFGVEVDGSGDAPIVWLGARSVRFVPADRVHMTAIELRAASAEPSTQVSAGVEIRVLAVEGATR